MLGKQLTNDSSLASLSPHSSLSLMRSFSPPTVLLFCLILTLCGAGQIGAQTTPPAVNVEERETVRTFHNTYYPRSEGVALGYTGPLAAAPSSPTKADNVAAAFRTAALLRTNYYRRLAGLNPVADSPTFDGRAQGAAFLMWTGGDYTNWPVRWASPAWNAEAYEGASRSDKAPSLSTGWESGSDINGFMQEEGTTNKAVARRQWLLFPPTLQMGYGATPGASALYVRENGNDTIPTGTNQAQSWPPRGFLPATVPFSRWSWAWLSPTQADLKTATVQVLRDGVSVPVTVVERAARLVWDFPADEFGPERFPPAADTAYTVSLRGLKIDGVTRGFDYTVILFDPAQPHTGQAPVVLVSPEDAVIAENSSLTLQAEASDGSLQWFKDGMMVPGAARANLVITAARTTDTGDYWVEVRNSVGLVRSATTKVLVLPANLTAPTITTQPQSSTFVLGGPASLSVVASSPAPMTYQWRKAGVALPGRTLSRLEFASLATADAGNYDVVVTNHAGSTTSTSARLGVFVLGQPPAITTQPTSRTVEAGTRVTFTVTVTSQQPPSYKWRKNGVVIAGATTNTLEIPSAGSANVGSYDVVVTSLYGTVTSQAATLSVIGMDPPVITTQPTAQTVFSGSKSLFIVAATGPGQLTYQWSKNGVAIAEATSPSLIFPVTRATDSGLYSVTVTASSGTVVSNAVALKILAPTIPIILTQPTSQQVALGASVALTVEAEGRPRLTYQWRKNGVLLSGATKASLSIPTVNSATIGSYDVVVSNGYGSITSSAAVVGLSEPAVAPVITTPPASLQVSPGDPVTLQVEATGTPPLAYQWYKGGVTVAGATASTYSLASATTAHSGVYSVAVSNAAGTTTSSDATLTVSEQPSAPPIIDTQPADVFGHADDRVGFNVQASGHPLTYQWYLNGDSVPGQTSSSFPAFELQPYQNGWKFHCVVTNSLGSTTTREAVVTLWANDVFLGWETHPTDAVTPIGGTATFTSKAAAYGNASISYQWYINETLIPGAGDATLRISGVEGYHYTDYHVVATATIAGVVRTLRSDNVWVGTSATPPAITQQPADVYVRVDDKVEFSVQARGYPLTYQWYLNGSPVPGQTSRSFTPFAMQPYHSGWKFHCVVTNSLGSTSTREAMPIILTGSLLFDWVKTPTDAVASIGGTATFESNAVAYLGAPVSYQWYMGETPIPGATSPSLTITGIEGYHFMDYHVVATTTIDGVAQTLRSATVVLQRAGTQ